MTTLTSLQKISLVTVKSTAFIIFGICSFLEVPQAQARCRDGSLPERVCEIVDGRKVCHRQCTGNEFRGKQKKSHAKNVSGRYRKSH